MISEIFLMSLKPHEKTYSLEKKAAPILSNIIQADDPSQKQPSAVATAIVAISGSHNQS